MPASNTVVVDWRSGINGDGINVQLLPMPRHGTVYVLHGAHLFVRSFSSEERMNITLTDRALNGTFPGSADPQVITSFFRADSEFPDVAAVLFASGQQTDADRPYHISVPTYDLHWARELWAVGFIESLIFSMQLYYSLEKVTLNEWATLSQRGVTHLLEANSVT